MDYMALTQDGWTSRSGDWYVGATAHGFIFEEKLQRYVLKTIVLGLEHLPESHTAEALAAALKKQLAKFKVPMSKVISVTHDNAAAQVKAIVTCLNSDGVDSCSCSDHCLDLAVRQSMLGARRNATHHNVETGMDKTEFEFKSGAYNVVGKYSKVEWKALQTKWHNKTIQSALRDIKQVVTYVNSNDMISSAVSNAFADMRLKTRKLVQSVKTRWNSDRDMAMRAVGGAKFFKVDEKGVPIDLEDGIWGTLQKVFASTRIARRKCGPSRS
jgi:hypothetical protein